MFTDFFYLLRARGIAVTPTEWLAFLQALESGLADGQPRQPSLFTAALTTGLATGDADRDEDGWVSLNELYEYVFDAVRDRPEFHELLRATAVFDQVTSTARQASGRER